MFGPIQLHACQIESYHWKSSEEPQESLFEQRTVHIDDRTKNNF